MSKNDLFCKIGVHRYSNWESYRFGKVLSSYGDAVVGHYMTQTKNCVRCNKMKMRKIFT